MTSLTGAMARTSKKQAKAAVEKKTKNDAAQLETLAEAAKENVKKYNKVINTEKSYLGYIRSVKKFLESQVADRRSRNITVCEQGIPTDELEKALDNPPNQYSALVIEMFITHKCFILNRKKGVAESVHAAYCRYWDTMDGDKYAGKYKLDEETKQVSGCPARAPHVLEIKKAAQTRGKKDGATRKHAEAISIEEMKKLVQWSLRMCSEERLERRPRELMSRGGNEELVCAEEPLSVEELLFLFEHGFMNAFVSSAFTLWTRCFELLSLTVGDIKLDCEGPAPYYTPHDVVTLDNRKGWQNAQGYDGPRKSNTYQIYQQHIPEIDMYSHLRRWLKLYAVLLGRELEPKDQVFPHISANGTVNPRQEMSYDCFSKLLTKFTSGAGLEGHFTTHSFRRGGAQYRFIFAPAGLRWSLNICRWWGGWAEGESVDTLMKYLLDSLQSYENGHGDALHPVPNGFNESFLGERIEAASVTAGEVREFKRSVDDKLSSLDQKIEQRLDNMITQITSTLTATHLPINQSVSLPSSFLDRREHAVRTIRTTSTPYPPRSPSVSSCSSSDSAGDSESPVCSGQKKSPRTAPIPGVFIPDLKAGANAWKEAIKQWEEGDATIGLKALKEWPEEWYTGNMRTFTGSKRRDRQLVALAYEKVGCNESAFLADYPEARKNMRTLLEAIRRDRDIAKRRKSRNGTPEERDAKRCSPSRANS
ncbi:hypothetical protein LshimejAT787_0900180 [Lyophyllum shimeji]|uniref:Tyr recombinase domain-containing protein n=1 Tax=Lyophyllum shimeji TaxID=47721 RepID=A0A9P3PSJ7_LYOSH|nr:hypothetical protein LshimejAT787_0900180 [Lyophyllum shimeji]